MLGLVGFYRGISSTVSKRINNKILKLICQFSIKKSITEEVDVDVDIPTTEYTGMFFCKVYWFYLKGESFGAIITTKSIGFMKLWFKLVHNKYNKLNVNKISKMGALRETIVLKAHLIIIISVSITPKMK